MHPHINCRQPRNNSTPGTNPPVFVWKPRENKEVVTDNPGDPKARVSGRGKGFCLIVSKEKCFKNPCLRAEGLKDPVFLPENKLDPGKYYWKWKSGSFESETYSFDVKKSAVTVEVPGVEKWFASIKDEHPRIYVNISDLKDFRGSRFANRKPSWDKLKGVCAEIIKEDHEIQEPPYLPDKSEDFEAHYNTFSKVMWRTRRFMKGAELLAFSYLASGETRYADAARKRILSICEWNPEGSSHLEHNDEAHMPVVWWGPYACDWIWDVFTEREKETVIEHMRLRGNITFKYMHDRGAYGINRFNSHAAREITFLAQTALVFYEHIPESKKWLEWIRPVLCGIWPVWAGDDGAWAEGVSYSTAYVNVMARFAVALKNITGVNLFRRPFWKNHAFWRFYCFPPYAEWVGFGDHTERFGDLWASNANLVEIIKSETKSKEFAGYINEFRKEAKKCYTPPERSYFGMDPLEYVYSSKNENTTFSGKPLKISRVFPGAGWASIRDDFNRPEEGSCLVFRSSPFGSISHSHANNNDFFIHVGGKIMAMPSGYYDGYGSNHHKHWVWHTKSHNCITLSGAPQLKRSHESRGYVTNHYEDESLVYFCGIADESYERVLKARRHVLFLKNERVFLLFDEIVGNKNIISSAEWNLHSFRKFKIDEQNREIEISKKPRALKCFFMYHKEAFFSLSKGWDPPPVVCEGTANRFSQWKMQHNLKFVVSQLLGACNIGVIMAPLMKGHKMPGIRTFTDGGSECATIEKSHVILKQGEDLYFNNRKSRALSVVESGGAEYGIFDSGIKKNTLKKSAV